MADRKLRDGHFRVALVGNDATLRGARQLDCLQRVQRSLPGVEFRSINTPHGWVSGLAPDFVEQLAECQPDLVLAVVAPGDDLAHELTKPSWFDWRGFAAAQLLGAELNDNDSRCDRFAGIAPHDHEAFLGAIAAELRPCRSPIEPSMSERWQQLFDALDVAAAVCVEQRVPLAVLVVPCPLQIDAELCRAVARRSGISVDALDLELPQRRLAGYAAQRQLPLVDLLPQMRSARQNVFEPNAAVLSEEGSRVAAGAIGGWLESRYGGALSLAAQLSIAP